jgi:alpha/beta superfamily hydrolase
MSHPCRLDGDDAGDRYTTVATRPSPVSDPVLIPGPRDVRGRLDRPDADGVVVACPPHPQYGGSRSDPRLRAVGDALAPGVACLRFDYGPWDDGEGERRDALSVISWARERFERVGLFGYSFGAGIALRAAADAGSLAACSVLAPPGDAAVVDAVAALDCPLQVVYGERDDTVDWAPVVERARELGHRVDSLAADHHFTGQHDRVGDLVAAFLQRL